MNFNSWQYFCAMSPIDLVIDAFLQEEQTRLAAIDDPYQDTWSIKSQSRFATLLASPSHSSSNHCSNGEEVVAWDKIHFLPSQRYVHKLINRYASRLEMENKELEDDNLALLICHLSRSKISNLPDSTHSCTVMYRVPLIDTNEINTPLPLERSNLLSIRVYPHHNDVGVAKVWEAGAALAEYIIHNPDIIRGRKVLELGAGVGLTGLVAAGCGTESMHLTDYTVPTLENLAYNVRSNAKWLEDRGVDPSIVTIGHLEWGDNNDSNDCETSSLRNANVVIAADVIYAVECIPDLVSTVSKFLSSGSDRVALFATTHRNRNTFDLFERELEKKLITSDYKSQDSLPYVFPCYFNQPRSDVRICTMKMY